MNNLGKKLFIAFLMYFPIGYTVSYLLPDYFWTAVIINSIIFYATYKFLDAVWD